MALQVLTACSHFNAMENIVPSMTMSGKIILGGTTQTSHRKFLNLKNMKLKVTGHLNSTRSNLTEIDFLTWFIGLLPIIPKQSIKHYEVLTYTDLTVLHMHRNLKITEGFSSVENRQTGPIKIFWKLLCKIKFCNIRYFNNKNVCLSYAKPN